MSCRRGRSHCQCGRSHCWGGRSHSQRSRSRSRCRRGRCRLDLCLLRGSSGEAIDAGGPGDLADSERETVRHGRGIRDDDHLAHLGSCTHTPYLARHCQRNLVGSLPRGMPKVVICR
jgi:hypothetical protein